MTPITFYTDDKGFARYRTDEDRLVPLGVWFMMELRNSPYQCLDLLAIIDDVASGRSDAELWDGEGFQVQIKPSGATTYNTILDSHRATYPLAELRSAAEDYWRYLAGRPSVEFDIKDWEQTWKRPHPYRGRLF